MSQEQAEISFVDYPENVRTRKEMYLTDATHTVFEIVDNSVDEFSAGRCNTIAVAIIDGVVTVEDDGGGIPITPHKDPQFKGLSQAEVAFTTLHAGGKFGKEGGYQTNTGGLHGVGASCVNAVATWMNLQIQTGGKKYEVEFEKGFITNGLHLVGDSDTPETTGTSVSYTLDPDIWEGEQIDLKKLRKRMKQVAYLNPGLTIYLYIKDQGLEVEENHHYPEGLKEYVTVLSENKKQLSDVAYINQKVEKTDIQIAFTYTSAYSQELYSFCNNVITEAGGDHLTGFNMGLSKAIERYALENKYIKNAKDISAEDSRDGIVAVISVKVPQPKFEGQGKSKIKMLFIRTQVRKVVEEFMYDYLSQDADRAKLIMDKVLIAAKARDAARKAKEAARGKQNLSEASGLPGKLADCQSKKPEECEIYFVEGDSAGGSAKGARDRKTQAILPVFGKILNVEKTTVDKVVKNIKLSEIIKALRCGVDETFNIKKLRYHKIIIMSDADKQSMSAA